MIYSESFSGSKSVEILCEEGHIYDIEYRTSVYSYNTRSKINATFAITIGEEVIYSSTFFDEGDAPYRVTPDEDRIETGSTASVSHTYSRNLTRTMNYTISIIINSYTGNNVPRSSIKIYKDLVWSLGFPSWPWIILIITTFFFLSFFFLLAITFLFFFIWYIYKSRNSQRKYFS